jgi:PAS domain S-box-containing protein
VRAEREQARLRASQLLGEAESARAAAEAIRAEFAFDDLPLGPTDRTADAPARPPMSMRTPLAKPIPDGPVPVAQAAGPAPELPPAQAGVAIALIGIDGTFKRLDENFCSLLGCREDELRSARWPSIIDRDNLDAHREIARALRAGEIPSAEIETVYMHAGGLLVPIEGTVSMLRDGAGQPTHYLFRADVRRTSGAAF